MRFEDLVDYFKLRKLTLNPWEICRFRRGQEPGGELAVRFPDRPPLYLYGGKSDYHMFHRIFLRDEYRLASVPKQSWQAVVDLGANVGIFSARAAELADAVYAFEPFPGHAEQLTRNLSPRENVSIAFKAVSGDGEPLSLFLPEDEGRSGAYSACTDLNVNADASVQVPSMTLNRIFSENRIETCDLLKIDIEGKEYEVIHAADDDVLSRIRRIHGEYHNVDPDQAITRIDHFRAHLVSKGYDVDVVPHRRKANHGMFYARRK